MICCNLKGGLGNMLFQIAAAKSMAVDTNNKCCFPNLNSHLHYLDSDMMYNPVLRHSSEYMKLLKNLEVCGIVDYGNTIKFPFEYVEVQLSKYNTYIDGFFQSEKYFKHNRKEVLEFLDFSFISQEYIDEKYGFFRGNHTTSIHVRRGDYLRHPNHHPPQTLEYYMEGVEMLKDKTDLFVIFSDDIEWCKVNLDLDNAVYIENEKDYIELYLMKICNNNITCNSSFGWWGAWLNENSDKIVIGPKIWFGSAIQHNTGDIIPEDWIKI
jgi:hypothetical protein